MNYGVLAILVLMIILAVVVAAHRKYRRAIEAAPPLPQQKFEQKPEPQTVSAKNFSGCKKVLCRTRKGSMRVAKVVAGGSGTLTLRRPRHRQEFYRQASQIG